MERGEGNFERWSVKQLHEVERERILQGKRERERGVQGKGLATQRKGGKDWPDPQQKT